MSRALAVGAAVVLAVLAAAAPRISAAQAVATKAATEAPAAGARLAAMKLPIGGFGTVTVYRPAEHAASVALFVSGDGGWQLGVVSMAQALADDGAVVVGIDVRAFLAVLKQAKATPCESLAADFERLSHEVQKRIGMRDYHVPVLVGYSSGATIVYATLVQAPAGTFAGAMSLGFCPDQEFGRAPLCTGSGLHSTPGQKGELILAPAERLAHPWIALQGQQDQVCDAKAVDAFVARTSGGEVVRLPKVGHGFGVARNWLPQFLSAYQGIVTAAAPPLVSEPAIQDLPLREVPATGAEGSDLLALLLTGDGGWAGLDRELAAQLAASGVPTVAFNSLRYFWQQRSPEQTARDVSRALHHYLVAWHKPRFVLVGYSFGADVAPFVARRLPADLAPRLAAVALLGADAHADFEIRVADFIPGSDAGDHPVLPELAALRNVPVLCLYGEEETDSLCPQLPAGRFTIDRVAGGHHFGGDYTALADRILKFAREPRPTD